MAFVVSGNYVLLPERVNSYELFRKVEANEKGHYHIFYHANPRKGPPHLAFAPAGARLVDRFGSQHRPGLGMLAA